MEKCCRILSIQKDLFNELVQTAEIALSPSEAEKLCQKLNEQMQIIRQLEAIPLDEEMEPVIHGNPYPLANRCILREDVSVLFANPGGIIEQAPLSKDGYFVSPDVAHQRIG